MGSRFLIRVLGRKNRTFMRTLRVLLETLDFTAFAVFAAFLAPPSSPPVFLGPMAAKYCWQRQH